MHTVHLLATASLKNRALIALVTIVVAVFGSIALTSLKQELIPSIQFPQIAVVTSYAGASPEVVNQSVSVPIEQALRGIAGLESTSATSSPNRSLVTAAFSYGTNLAQAEQRISQAINRIRSSLPTGLDPQVLSGSIDDLPVVRIAVTGASSQDLAATVRQSVLPAFDNVPGVRAASLTGESGQRVTITADAAKLAARGLSTQSLRDALSAANVLVPAGSITEGGKTLSVQSGSRLGSVEEIAGLPILSPGASGGPGGSGNVPKISDVATVQLTENPVSSISQVNGQTALTIAITKLPAANTVEVSRAVREALPGIAATAAAATPGAAFTVVFDQAPFIQQSIDSLATEGLLGLVFAVLVILLFLLSVRATLVTAISIPTSVLVTFIGLQAFGYTLNIITLGALTIAIGRVVDDSIVVIENIKRHLTEARPADGTDRAATIIRAVREVAGAVTASTVTTVAVFLPLAFVGGTTGELFRPFALTVSLALLASLVVALSIVPVLAFWFLRGRVARRSGSAGAASDRSSRLQGAYLPVLLLTLRRPVATILAAVLLLGGTVALLPTLKTSFLGSSGQNTLTVTQTLPSGASLTALDTAAMSVEQRLRAVPGVVTVQLSIGSSGSALRDAFLGGSASQVLYSVTTDPAANQDALQAEVRRTLADVAGAGTITVAASSGFGSSSSIAVNVTARSQQALADAADAVMRAVQQVPAVVDVTSNLANSQDYLAVTVDRAAAARAGYSEVQLAGLVAAAMQPTAVGSITLNERQLTIYLQSSSSPTTRDELAALPIATRQGPVALSTLATVQPTAGPATVTTVDNFRSATITATPATDNLGGASAAVQAAVSGLTLPAGATAKLGGVTADQGDAFSQLGLALLVAILIVYIVMVATFRSLLQPLLLLVSIPFAATGAVLLQVVTGIPLGVASLIGVLMLIGIVVTNAIVLIDLVNQYRNRGLPVRQALEEGASRRLRPILMTALATIFALLPMALGLTGTGGFISQPLALVVIGGLVSSTLLTLIVVPVLYLLVEGRREDRALRRRADGGAHGSGTGSGW